MIAPLALMSRMTGLRRPPHAIGRCVVCRADVHEGSPTLLIRGDLLVHRECATYRLRQQARVR